MHCTKAIGDVRDEYSPQPLVQMSKSVKVFCFFFPHNLSEQFNSKVKNLEQGDDVDIVAAMGDMNQSHEKKTNRCYPKVYLIQLLRHFSHSF